LGGTDQIAKSLIGYVVEAEVFTHFSSIGNWPNLGTLQMPAMNPLQLYMQYAEQWQKSWAEAMAFWSKSRS
jgi:hypothetical protein